MVPGKFSAQPPVPLSVAVLDEEAVMGRRGVEKGEEPGGQGVNVSPARDKDSESRVRALSRGYEAMTSPTCREERGEGEGLNL